MSIKDIVSEAAINPKVTVPIATTATSGGLGGFSWLTETVEFLAIVAGLMVAVLTCVAQWLRIQKLQREKRRDELRDLAPGQEQKP